jgi:hypothetical protein
MEIKINFAMGFYYETLSDKRTEKKKTINA